jgi:hypothetical protein
VRVLDGEHTAVVAETAEVFFKFVVLDDVGCFSLDAVVFSNAAGDEVFSVSFSDLLFACNT